MIHSSMAQEARESDAWHEDLQALHAQLEAKHLNLYHTLSKLEFERGLAALREVDGGDSKHVRLVELMRLVRRIGDGHTSVPLWGAPLRRFPLEVRMLESRALVVGAADRHAALLGADLVSVNGVPVADIAARLAAVVPFVENAQSLSVRVGQYFMVEELLAGLSVVDYEQPAMFAFRALASGEEKTISLRGLARESYAKLAFERLRIRRHEVFFADKPASPEPIWFSASNDHKTVYIQFDGYPGAAEMQAFGESVVDFINQHGSRNLILDMRENFGGDFYVGLILASILNLADSIDWEQGVYGLIGRNTFSAGMSNAAQFRQVLNAKLVGEPTGARPCGFQDMDQFTLPNSGVLVTYSKRYFCFEQTQADTVKPDVLVPTRAETITGEQDPALNWVMQDIQSRGYN